MGNDGRIQLDLKCFEKLLELELEERQGPALNEVRVREMLLPVCLCHKSSSM